MKPSTLFSVVLAVVIATGSAGCSCGDQKGDNDANPRDGNPDAPDYPDAPALGPQIDRMGRPAISTALVATFFETAANKPAMKDAYNQAADPASWRTTPLRGTGTGEIDIGEEFARNLAIYDVLDKGFVMNGGCGNQALYNNSMGGGPMVTSYNALASALADDQLYVDTSRTTCNNYLSVEIEFVSRGVFELTQCGGRTPTHDVIDVTYSILAAGTAGFEIPSFNPRLGDGVNEHADVSDTVFPFLGPPH